MSVMEWYQVRFDKSTVFMSAAPPNRSSWDAQFEWKDITRVCLQVEDFIASDGLYIFTSKRPESFAIPIESDGGAKLLDELIRRKLFDAELAIKASTADKGLFCWPRIEE